MKIQPKTVAWLQLIPVFALVTKLEGNALANQAVASGYGDGGIFGLIVLTLVFMVVILPVFTAYDLYAIWNLRSGKQARVIPVVVAGLAVTALAYWTFFNLK